MVVWYMGKSLMIMWYMGKSLMVVWYKASQWHGIFCHNPDAMSSNAVELERRLLLCLSRTLTKI